METFGHAAATKIIQPHPCPGWSVSAQQGRYRLALHSQARVFGSSPLQPGSFPMTLVGWCSLRDGASGCPLPEPSFGVGGPVWIDPDPLREHRRAVGRAPV